ncbi:MAG: replication-associated recombination protein A, partial [Clostridiaceae bacterium]|nr:replication-associated recombination protein A [Clostridiaceae bacterium]
MRWSNQDNPKARGRQPLAYRMMPRTLADFIGQRHILEEGKMLWRMITADRLASLIFFGP